MLLASTILISGKADGGGERERERGGIPAYNNFFLLTLTIFSNLCNSHTSTSWKLTVGIRCRFPHTIYTIVVYSVASLSPVQSIQNTGSCIVLCMGQGSNYKVCKLVEGVTTVRFDNHTCILILSSRLSS